MAVTAAALAVEFEATGVDQATRAIDTVDRKVRDSGASARAGGAALTGMAAAAALGFKQAIGVTASFDKQLSAIASVGGKDAQARLAEIRATALKLGADTSFSASEAAAGMEELIKAGLPVTDVLGGAAAAALDLSAATGTEVPRSATLMATALNVFSHSMSAFTTEGEKATHIANLFAQVANASAADVGQLGLAFSQAATVADMFGISIDDTATALGILHQKGILGSDAGTSLRQMLLSLTRQTKPAREALSDLGLTFDSFFDSAGNFLGIEAMFEIFRQAMERSGYTAEQINDTFAQIFGSDAVRAASVFFRTQDEGWADMRAGMAAAGTVQEQAALRLDNLAGDAEQLSGSLETLTIRFTSFTTGPLRALVQTGTRAVNWIGALPPEIQQLIVLLGGLGVALAGIVGGWALFGNQIGLAVRGLMLLSGPLLLITGLVAGLFVAWQNNWGGIQEITNKALNGVGETLTRMSRFFQAAKDRGLTPFRLAMRTLIVSLSERIEDDHPVIGFLRGILRNGERLAGWLTQDGIPTVRRFIRALTEGDFEAAGDLFAGLLEDIRGGWDRKIAPWIDEQLRKLRAFPGLLLGNLLKGAREVNWPLVGQTVQDNLGSFTDWTGDRLGEALTFGGSLVQAIFQGFQGVNWDLVGGAIQSGAQGAVGVLAGLGGWVGDELGKVNWDTVGATLDTAARLAFVGIIRGAQAQLALLAQLAGWTLEQLGKVDWSFVLTSLTTKGGELAGGLLTGLREKWDTELFPTLQGKFVGLILWLTTDGLPSIVERMVTGGANLIGGMVQGLVEHWPEISTFFTGTLIPGIVALMVIAPTLLASAGIGIIRGLLAGASQVWHTQLGPWFEERKAGVLAFFAGAAEWLVSRGGEILDGLRHGIVDKWNNDIMPWFDGMQQAFANFFGPNPETWLSDTGSRLLDGLRHGIQDFWNNTLFPWMGGMKQSFLNFFTGAGEWLVGIGSDIIGGLKKGVEENWENFSGWFGEQIAKLPGVGEEAVEAKSPARAFFPLGASMIQGIGVGAEREMPNLESRFQRLMTRMADVPLDEVFRKTQQRGEIFFNAWAAQNEQYFDDLQQQFGERAAGIMRHFFMVVSQGEAHSDVLTRFRGRMREAMEAIGEDMSDGLFSGWETYERQFGSRVVGRLKAGFERVTRFLGVEGQDINRVLAHLGSDSGERFAGGIEKGVRRGVREVEIAPPAFRSLGRNTSQSLADGYMERSSALGEAIRRTVEQAIAQMKERLGIASPSRLFRWFGQMSLGGLIEGWQSQEGRFLSLVDSTVGRAAAAIGQMAGMNWGTPALATAGVGAGWSPRPVSPPMAPVAMSASTPTATPSSGTVVHQTNYITVSLDELEEMVEAGKFVRDLEGARTLYLGDA